MVCFAKIRDGHSKGLDAAVVARLERNALITKVGSGKSQRYILGKDYQALTTVHLTIGSYAAEELTTLVKALQSSKEVKMGELVKAFNGRLSREQVKYLVEKLVDDHVFERSGKGSNTTYKINAQFDNSKDQLKEIEEYLKQLQHKSIPQDLTKFHKNEQ